MGDLMRPVLTTIGTTGDVQPLIALAVELRKNGHRPLLALSPNFADRADELGLEFAPLGPRVSREVARDVISAQSRCARPADQVRYFLDASLPVLPRIFKELLELCRGADVLIGPPYQFACRMVHETTSIPFVSLHLSQFGDLGGKEVRELSSALINPYRLREGLPPLADPLGADGNSSQLALYAVSQQFLRRPQRWPDHYHVVGFLFLDDESWQPDPDLREFVEAGPPFVVVTFGSVIHSEPKSVTNLILNAIGHVKCRTIIQHGWSGLAEGSLPQNVYATGFVPHSWLFPKAAVVIHHGGAGTSASTFRAGVPTVVVPHDLDQPLWAELAKAKRCTRTVIPFLQLTSDRLASGINDALESVQARQAAATLGHQIRAERGVEVARSLIEKLIVH
jgi:sterol 3beta-glucosyltransferase